MNENECICTSDYEKERPMRIMVVNDDGIESDGIRRLAGMAAELGEVWVVAPRHQCSAMSHCITVRGSLHMKEESFPVPGVKAYRNSRRLCEGGDKVSSATKAGYCIFRDKLRL